MNKELQIDDLTRGINDEEPMFNETERQEQEAPAPEAREHNTAHPGDKCWQDFMAYLEVPADGDGKAGRLVCKLDRDLATSKHRRTGTARQAAWSASSTATWPTRSTTATSGAAAVPTS